MKFIRTQIQNIKALAKDEDGLTTVEYALLLVLVAIVAVGAWRTLGSAVSSNATSAAGILNGG